MDNLEIKDGGGAARTLRTTDASGIHIPHHLARGWDGSSSQPLKADSSGILEVNTELPAAAALADGASNPTAPAVGAAGLLYNGSTYDRERGNVEGTLLVSAARTATNASDPQTNYNHRGVVLFLYVTAMPGGGETLTVQLQLKDPVSGWGTYVAFPAVALTGYYQYVVYPGAAESIATANFEVAALPLGRTWRVNMVHSGSGSWTYSLGYALMV